MVIESVDSPPRIDETPTESAQTSVFWAIKPTATPEELAAAGHLAASESLPTEAVASAAPELVSASAPDAAIEPAAPQASPDDWLVRADPGLLTLTRAEGEAARVLTSLIG